MPLGLLVTARGPKKPPIGPKRQKRTRFGPNRHHLNALILKKHHFAVPKKD